MQRQLAIRTYSEPINDEKESNKRLTISSKTSKSKEDEHRFKKRRRIEMDISQSPQDVLTSLIRNLGYEYKARSSLSLDDFFELPTEKQIESFNVNVVKVVREGNLEKLRLMHKDGQTLQCCNRFGESLLHMACRRGLIDIVKYLINEANVSLRLRDDFGRTPLHDAFWTGEPNLCLIEFMLTKEPDLILMKDKRGHCPLEYARKNHWSQWSEFLISKPNLVEPRAFRTKTTNK